MISHLTARVRGEAAREVARARQELQLAEEAQRANLEARTERLRNALLSAVSHDLRTPLAVVKGAATALLEAREAMPPAQRDEHLRAIASEASRLNRLVGNLLQMTRLEAGALRVAKDWNAIEETIGSALSRLDEGLGERRVVVEVAPSMPLVAYDAILLEQVLVNLVDNAIKYSPAASPIELRATWSPEALQVEVNDRGGGVAEADSERIFDRFYRLSTARGGIGLGLSICRGIVAAHGGTIVQRDREGGGASFRFTLPRLADDGPPRMPIPDEEPSSPP